jgi:hypothetical protein
MSVASSPLAAPPRVRSSPRSATRAPRGVPTPRTRARSPQQRRVAIAAGGRPGDFNEQEWSEIAISLGSKKQATLPQSLWPQPGEDFAGLPSGDDVKAAASMLYGLPSGDDAEAAASMLYGLPCLAECRVVTPGCQNGYWMDCMGIRLFVPHSFPNVHRSTKGAYKVSCHRRTRRQGYPKDGRTGCHRLVF